MTRMGHIRLPHGTDGTLVSYTRSGSRGDSPRALTLMALIASHMALIASA